jgi:hypothetical protein
MLLIVLMELEKIMKMELDPEAKMKLMPLNMMH